ncbi:MAG: N-acetyltransferase [Thalassobaculales bacterium]
MRDVWIRDELPGDHEPVRRLLLDCFPGPQEAGLVAQLRDDGDAVVGLVATAGAAGVVGHVMLSVMQAPFRALALAPVAVAAPWRRQGIATRLIDAAIGRAGREGWQAIFVLGNPDFYGRFGFTVEMAAGFASPYAGPWLMARALPSGRLPTMAGPITHARALASLG